MEIPLHYGLDLIAWSWREWFFFGLGIASAIVVIMLPWIIEHDNTDEEVIGIVNDVINSL
ncbi:MAG: hypothetical protein ACE5LB_05900 [Acidiferrobacterales bacterium]